LGAIKSLGKSVKVKIIDRKFADREILAKLKNFPIAKKYRKEILNSLQILDYWMLSEAEKIISLDSDILFFKNPDQLINWFSTEKNFIYSQSDNQNLIQKNILEETGCRLSESEPFLNNGFLGFPRQTLNLPNIEEALKEVIKACKNLENTHSFFEKKIWVLGENTLALLVKKRLFRL